MARFLSLILAIVLMALSGCSKSDSSSNTPTGPPAGTLSENEPNDGTPQSLGQVSGNDIMIAGIISNNADIDKFAVTLTSATNLFAKVSWTGAADLDLWILSDTQIPLTVRDTGVNSESCVLTGRAPGNYVIQVSAKTGGSGQQYILTVGRR